MPVDAFCWRDLEGRKGGNSREGGFWTEKRPEKRCKMPGNASFLKAANEKRADSGDSFLEQNCPEGALLSPPRAGLWIHVLKKAQLARRVNFGVGPECFARVNFPTRLIPHDLERIGFVVESAGAQARDGARHGIAAHVNHFRPHMLALLRADRRVHLDRELEVVFLWQARANHSEGSEAVILQPVQRRDPL